MWRVEVTASTPILLSIPILRKRVRFSYCVFVKHSHNRLMVHM